MFCVEPLLALTGDSPRVEGSSVVIVLEFMPALQSMLCYFDRMEPVDCELVSTCSIVIRLVPLRLDYHCNGLLLSRFFWDCSILSGYKHIQGSYTTSEGSHLWREGHCAEEDHQNRYYSSLGCVGLM